MIGFAEAVPEALPRRRLGSATAFLGGSAAVLKGRTDGSWLSPLGRIPARQQFWRRRAEGIVAFTST